MPSNNHHVQSVVAKAAVPGVFGAWPLTTGNLKATVGNDMTAPLNPGFLIWVAEGWQKGVSVIRVEDEPTFPMQGTGPWRLSFTHNPDGAQASKEPISTRTGEDFSGCLLLGSANSLRLLLSINGNSAWAVDSGNKTFTDNVSHDVILERVKGSPNDFINFKIDASLVHQATILPTDTVNYGGAGLAFGAQNVSWGRAIATTATFKDVVLRND